MLVHPWDVPLDDAEWREWLGRNDFGQLVASGRDRDVPIVVPRHFRYDGVATIELHLPCAATVVDDHYAAGRLAERDGPGDAAVRTHLLRRSGR